MGICYFQSSKGFAKRKSCLTSKPSTIKQLSRWGGGGQWMLTLTSAGLLALSHNIINNLGVGTEWKLSKTADNTKLREVVDYQGFVLPFQGTWPEQDREIGWQEPHKVQKGEVQSSAPWRGKASCINRLWEPSNYEADLQRRTVRDPGGQQTDHKPAMCDCGKEGQEPPEVH